MELVGKRALVTGAAIRIGRGIALGLAAQGVHIALHFGRSEEEALATQAELESLGVRAPRLQADLANPEAAASLVDRSVEALEGPLDILVNSAAIYPEGGLAETDLALWESTMAINLRAPYQLAQAFAAQAPEGGNIINILDARSNRPAADHLAYRLSKVALDAMTRNLATELAPAIRVNGLALGAMLPPPGAPSGHLEQIVQTRVPLRRSGSPEIVAQNVLHLLKQEFLTGVIIPLDGGEFL